MEAAEQRRIAKLVVFDMGNVDIASLRFLGALDVAYLETVPGAEEICVASIVVVDMSVEKAKDAPIVYSDCIVTSAPPAAYAPGFQCFREGPLMVRLVKRMQKFCVRSVFPEIFLVDGNGVLHERRCGLGCFVGVATGMRTLGVAKKYYGSDEGKEAMVEFFKNSNFAQNRFDIRDSGGHVLGAAVLNDTAGGVGPTSIRPIYVSAGHRIDLDSAVAVVRRIWGPHRLPVPLKLTDGFGRRVLKAVLANGVEGLTSEVKAQPGCDVPCEWYAIGSGARHTVLGHSHWVDIVVRVEKDEVRNNYLEVTRKINYFNHVVKPRLPIGFICDQRVHRFGEDSWAVRTRNLIGATTIELKPKSSLSDGTRDRFLERNSNAFDPLLLYSRKEQNMASAIRGAATGCKKKYFKVLANENGVAENILIDLAVAALMKNGALLEALAGLHVFGSDEMAIIACDLLDQNNFSEKDFLQDSYESINSLLNMTESEFAAAGAGNPQAWISAFLTGRMAMDVSLIVNFFQPAYVFPPQELKVTSLTPEWSCTIGVVDTELKPVWKVERYAMMAREGR